MQLLMLCGSLRGGSSNAALLNTAVQLLPPGVNADRYDGLDTLPHFNPDEDREDGPPHPAVADLRRRLAAADAVLISTPEYAGALPGSFKNLLDWAVGGGEVYGKAVAWVNTAGRAAPTGGADAHASLNKVLSYLGANLIASACVRIPLDRQDITAGQLGRTEARQKLAAALAALLTHAQDKSGRGPV